MFFRNLMFFRFPIGTLSFKKLREGAETCQLQPVGPLELSSRGFVSPLGRDSDTLIFDRGFMAWLSIGGEDKILPGAVVEAALAKKLAEVEKAEGRKPGGRARKRIKDEVITDLLPRAFTRPSRTDAYLDLKRGVLVVDTSSRKVGEAVVSEIRRALGSFPALPIHAEKAPRAVLHDLHAGELLHAEHTLALGDEAILEDPMSGGAVVRVSQQELRSDEIGKHLESGKQFTRVGLSLNDHTSFTLDEDLVVRKFKLLDGAIDNLGSGEAEDMLAELEARFFLLTTEVGTLFDMLEHKLRLSKVEA